MDTLRRLALAVALLGLPACLNAPNEETSTSTSSSTGSTVSTTGHGSTRSTGTSCEHTREELCQRCPGQCSGGTFDSSGCITAVSCPHTGTNTLGTTGQSTTGTSCQTTRAQLCASCGGSCTLGTDADGCLVLASCESTDTGSTGTTGTGCQHSAAELCSSCGDACTVTYDSAGCAVSSECVGGQNTSTTGTTGQGGTTGQCLPAGAQGSTGGMYDHCEFTNAYENCSQRQVACTGTSCTCTEGNTQRTVYTASAADCGYAYRECFQNTPPGTTGQGGSSTPLVLSFDGAAVAFVAAPGRFELSGRGDRTDWVTAATPWLALDVNGNGRIDDGGELFGSLTALPDGRRARDGFEALAALDANRDGVIDARDPAFRKLVLWRDDGDRVSQRGELQPLAQAGVLSLELTYASGRACDARGNCEVERARFTFQGPHGKTAQGSLVDVHLAHQPVQVASRHP